MNKIKQCIEENEKEFDEKFDTIDWADDICDIRKWHNNIKNHIKQSQTKLIESIIEKTNKLPDTNPKRESDEYDLGQREMKKSVINLLKESL